MGRVDLLWHHVRVSYRASRRRDELMREVGHGSGMSRGFRTGSDASRSPPGNESWAIGKGRQAYTANTPEVPGQQREGAGERVGRQLSTRGVRECWPSSHDTGGSSSSQLVGAREGGPRKIPGDGRLYLLIGLPRYDEDTRPSVLELYALAARNRSVCKTGCGERRPCSSRQPEWRIGQA